MGNPKKSEKLCQMCATSFAIAGEKYCKVCRKRVLAALRAEGYLQDAPRGEGIFRDDRGRKDGISINTLGGTAELNSDGDDW